LKKEKVNEDGKFTGEIIYKNAVVLDQNNGKNPIGEMPFTAAKEAIEGRFYPTVSEVAEMSKDLNIMFTDIVSIANNQGYGQAVIYYDTDEPPMITKTGPTHVINIPNKTGNSKFEFANPNPDLQGHLNIALALTRILLTTNDLTTDKVSGELNATNFASAIDRLIADSETIENIEDQRKKYVAIEKKELRIVILYLRYMMETGIWPEDYPVVPIMKLDPDLYELSLKFNNIKPLTTEKEKADTIDNLEQKGFILPYEKHMRFNEGMTDTEAKEREKLIQESKKQKMQEYIEMNKPDMMDMEDDDASESDKGNISSKNTTERQTEDRKPGDFESGRQKKVG